MRLANYSRMQSVLRRLSFGLGLSISLAAAATSHAAEAKFHSRGTNVDWSLHSEPDACHIVEIFISAGEFVAHQPGDSLAEKVMSVSLNRYDVCTGITEFSAFDLGQATAFEFDKLTNTWRLVGSITLVDGASGDSLDVEISLASRGVGPVYVFKEQSRTIDTSRSRDITKNSTAHQSADVLPGSYFRDDAGHVYDMEPGISSFIYSRQSGTITILQ